ncbi:MAG: DUF6049 family protein [Pseudolysinimonas sp.]|uniref:DUF6049 family protein n=1 Tax=Pseudolysinimonas sp. TaxID=2680009 RepID=UPI0032644007
MRRAAHVAASALLIVAFAAATAAQASAAQGDEPIPMTVAIVVPITAPEHDGSLLDADELALATAPTGALTRKLNAVLPTSATIAVDPMILASIRVLGAAAPSSALEWLDRLETAPNDVFLLAYADADLSPFARAGSLDLAQPLGFRFAIDATQFSPEQTTTPTASPTPTPSPTSAGPAGPHPYPTTDELLALPGVVGRIAWPAAGSVTSDDLPAYRDAGYDAVLLSSANASETSSARVDLGGVAGLVSDSAVSELLRQATAPGDDAARLDASARLGAALDGLDAAHPGRSVILALDRDATSTPFGLASALSSVESRASTRIVGLSRVLAGAAEPATVVETAAGIREQRAPALLAADRAEEAFANILADPLQLTAPRRLDLLTLFSVRDGDAAFSKDADGFVTRSAAILDSVSIVEGTPLLVTSSNTILPIRISNGLDFAVTVRVTARPLQPRIQIESPQDVTVEPGSSKVVKLNAQAITNGAVQVRVTLTSPTTGAQIGVSRLLPVDLQAQWETVGLIVGGVAALVFAVGIVRNVLLRRRRAAAARTSGRPAE